MAGKTCPQAGKAQVQRIIAVIEDVSGVQQPPTADGYISPAGRASMTQTPTYSASEELSSSLNTLDQFPNAVEAGQGSIPMYCHLDPSYGKPQGDALLTALMGDYNDPTLFSALVSNVSGIDVADTEIDVDTIVNDNMIDENILKGKLPPIGVIKIGDEKIAYYDITYSEDGSTATLGQCKRGYGGTTASVHNDGDEIKVISRTYTQSICRPTLTIYELNDDKLMLFMSGCTPTQQDVRLQKEQGQMLTFNFSGRQMGWCGVGEVAESPVGMNVKLTPGGADAYTPGGFIRNRTRGDDNSGKGYRIVAVDDANNTLTLSAAPTGWQSGDALYPWLPAAKPIGTALASRFVRVSVGNVAGKMNNGTLSYQSPASFLNEIGDDYPGEGLDTKRTITLNRSIVFRAKDGVEFGKGYRGYELPVTISVGKEPGMTLAYHMPRMKFNTPELSDSGEALTLTQNGEALGVTGEDALYIVQL